MRPTRGGRDDSGAAVVAALAMIAVLGFVTAVCVGSVAMVLAHRRAQVAADLGALAGASALQGGSDPCAAASTIAHRQRAAVTGCVVQGPTVEVTVVVDLPAALGGQVPARARAGAVPSGR